MEVTDDFIGSKVKIYTKNGSMEGFLVSIDTSRKYLTLDKVVAEKTDQKLQGLQNFTRYDFSKVEVIEDNRKKREKERKDRWSLLDGKHKDSPVHIVNRLRALDRKEMFLQSKDDGMVEQNGIAPADNHLPRLTQIKRLGDLNQNVSLEKLASQKWPNHYLIIENMNDTFRESIRYIRSQNLIGVAIEGLKLGRDGRLAFFQVSTRSLVIIYDVLSLGKNLFEEGLTEILQSESILKVIHDCRLASDLLYHRYDIKLVNVFDTQVAEVIIYRNQHNGELPRYVQGLSVLLVSHLHFSSGSAFFHKQRAECLEAEQKLWLVRPLPARAMEVAARHVMYLPELRSALMASMLQDFTDGVDLYLSLVRGAPDSTHHTFQENAHCLPKQFVKLRGVDRRLKEAYESRYRDRFEGSSMHDELGFRENCIGPLDTNIICSNDSIWHKGNGQHIQQLSVTQRLQECNRTGDYYLMSSTTQANIDPVEIRGDDDDMLLSVASTHSKHKRRQQKTDSKCTYSTTDTDSDFSSPRQFHSTADDTFPARDIRYDHRQALDTKVIAKDMNRDVHQMRPPDPPHSNKVAPSPQPSSAQTTSALNSKHKYSAGGPARSPIAQADTEACADTKHLNGAESVRISDAGSLWGSSDGQVCANTVGLSTTKTVPPFVKGLGRCQLLMSAINRSPPGSITRHSQPATPPEKDQFSDSANDNT